MKLNTDCSLSVHIEKLAIYIGGEDCVLPLINVDDGIGGSEEIWTLAAGPNIWLLNLNFTITARLRVIIPKNISVTFCFKPYRPSEGLIRIQCVVFSDQNISIYSVAVDS